MCQRCEREIRERGKQNEESGEEMEVRGRV